MIDTKKAIHEAKRSEYFGRVKLTKSMVLSEWFERFLLEITPSFRQYRKNKINRTLKYMWDVGDRVITSQGGATVVRNYKSIDSDGMGGFIQTDVRFDNPPEPNLQTGNINSYPYIGHYNQIFLERE